MSHYKRVRSLANVNKFKSSKTLQDPEAEDSNICPCSNCVHVLIADMLKIKLGNKQILRELESFNYPPCIDQLRSSRALCVLEKKGPKMFKSFQKKIILFLTISIFHGFVECIKKFVFSNCRGKIFDLQIIIKTTSEM